MSPSVAERQKRLEIALNRSLDFDLRWADVFGRAAPLKKAGPLKSEAFAFRKRLKQRCGQQARNVHRDIVPDRSLRSRLLPGKLWGLFAGTHDDTPVFAHTSDEPCATHDAVLPQQASQADRARELLVPQAAFDALFPARPSAVHARQDGKGRQPQQPQPPGLLHYRALVRAAPA